MHKTKRMFVPSPSLVPMNAGQWLFDDSEWRDEWGVRRRLYFVACHPHVVAEGMGTDEES